MTAVYRNNGDGTFTMAGSSLGQAWNGNMEWGDVNNNGWLDLVVTGQNEFMQDNKILVDEYFPHLKPYPELLYPHQAKIFINDKNGYVNDAPGFLQRVSIGFQEYGSINRAYNNTLALVDYNQNGSLDFFLAGTKGRHWETEPRWIYNGIYRNDMAELLNRPNTPPEPPETLSASESAKGGTVTFEWGVGSDAETPVAGLTYNIRVGTTPGGGEILSGANAHITPGRILIHGNKYYLQGIPAGTTLYWSVQTLDAGYSYSQWSEEQTLTLEGPLISPGDVNGDGAVTVADAIIVLRHVVGLIDIGEEYGAEALTRARVSSNAVISVADAIIILRVIVGLII